MRVIAVIDQPAVIEKILHHLGLWVGPSPHHACRAPPNTPHWEPSDVEDPMPDYENVYCD